MSEPATLMPPNASPLEAALDRLSVRMAALPAPIYDLWDADRCPLDILPLLAWMLSIDVWDDKWSETTKRAAVKAAIRVHRIKGTLRAVKEALVAAGYGDATVVERFGWAFYDGAHPHDGTITYAEPDHWAEYRVYLVRPITIAQAAQVRAILSWVAPARCRLKALDFTEALHLYDGTIMHDGQYTHGVA